MNVKYEEKIGRETFIFKPPKDNESTDDYIEKLEYLIFSRIRKILKSHIYDKNTYSFIKPNLNNKRIKKLPLKCFGLYYNRNFRIIEDVIINTEKIFSYRFN